MDKIRGIIIHIMTCEAATSSSSSPCSLKRSVPVMTTQSTSPSTLTSHTAPVSWTRIRPVIIITWCYLSLTREHFAITCPILPKLARSIVMAHPTTIIAFLQGRMVKRFEKTSSSGTSWKSHWTMSFCKHCTTAAACFHSGSIYQLRPVMG